MAALARVPNTRTPNPTPVTLTAARKREIVVAAFTAFGRKKLPTPRDIERVTEQILRRTTTDRTILSIAVTALLDAGVEAEATVGSLMNHLEMNQDEMNRAVCFCHNGAKMNGTTAARRFAAR